MSAVEDPAQHVDAVGEDEAHRSEYARQDVGEHQEADRENGHQVVVLVDVLAGVRREHVALTDPIHRQEIDGQAVPLQQALRQSTGDKVRSTIEEEDGMGVALAEGEGDQTDGTDAKEKVLEDTARLSDHIGRLLAQLHVPGEGLSEVEVGAVLDRPEYEAGGHAAQIVHHIVGGLLPEAQHRRHRHHILLALRKDLFEDTLLHEAQGQSLELSVEGLPGGIKQDTRQKVLQSLEGEIVHVLVER